MPQRPTPPGLALALSLAEVGWHIFPLAWRDKRPLANCQPCRTVPGPLVAHLATCPCPPAGRWCHGPYAATIDPARLTRWWAAEPRAIPGVAAGASGLVLIDIDIDHEPLPENLATHLLPGIDLAAEEIPASAWNDRARFRDGRDSLSLLARLRGRSNPWPQGDQYQPVAGATPSGGAHLWYRAPAPDLRQVIAKTNGERPYGLAWQVDIKAGMSYGVAPGAATAAGLYRLLKGDLANVGTMPPWFGTEVIRVALPPPPAPAQLRAALAARRTSGRSTDRAAAYIEAVLTNRIPQIERLREVQEGRPTELSALAYRIAGHLAAAGLGDGDIPQRLIDAGIVAGLSYRIAERTVTRAMNNGRNRPWPIPPPREHSGGSHATC